MLNSKFCIPICGVVVFLLVAVTCSPLSGRETRNSVIGGKDVSSGSGQIIGPFGADKKLKNRPVIEDELWLPSDEDYHEDIIPDADPFFDHREPSNVDFNGPAAADKGLGNGRGEKPLWFPDVNKDDNKDGIDDAKGINEDADYENELDAGIGEIPFDEGDEKPQDGEGTNDSDESDWKPDSSEDRSDEKPEDSGEDRSDEKPEESGKDNSDEKPEDSGENKSEEKPGDSDEDESGEKPKDSGEDKNDNSDEDDNSDHVADVGEKFPDNSEEEKHDSDEGKENDQGSNKVDENSSEEDNPGFNGGFILDTPFFNIRQVTKYFQQLERALEHVFRDTVDEATLLNGTYANTTEEEIEIDGKKYLVQKSIIKNGDNNSSIYIEALSAEEKRNGTEVSNEEGL